MKKYYLPLVLCLLTLIAVLYSLLQGNPTNKMDKNNHVMTMQHDPDPAEIRITSDGFTPEKVMVKLGQVVIFRSIDHKKHHIVSDEKELNLGNIDGIDTKSVLLTKQGTYTYHDTVSSKSTGNITVQ